MKDYKARLLKQQTGFTLIEVMVALAILAIGIMSVVGIQYHIVNGNTNANVVTQEMHLAQRLLERFKNVADPTTLSNMNLANVNETGQSGGPYNVTVAVSNPVGGSVSRFIRVTVTKTGGVGGHPVTLCCLTHGNGI